MRRIAFASSVALLTLVTACSTSSEPVDRTTAAPSEAPEPTVAAAPTTAAAPSASPAAGTESTQVLNGTVGTAANPEAFEITLLDSKGAAVTSLKAGKYLVKVKDLSAKFHNFHLTGTGAEEKTPVVGAKDVEWTVTFVAGTYTYLCDPHPSNMKKTFTVT